MPASERIRVMVVDDHSILRVGLKQVLESSGEFEVVGQARFIDVDRMSDTGSSVGKTILQLIQRRDVADHGNAVRLRRRHRRFDHLGRHLRMIVAKFQGPRLDDDLDGIRSPVADSLHLLGDMSRSAGQRGTT